MNRVEPSRPTESVPLEDHTSPIAAVQRPTSTAGESNWSVRVSERKSPDDPRAARRIVLLPGLDGTGALFEDFVRAAPLGVSLEIIAIPPESLGYSELVDRLGPTLHLTADTILVAESFSGPLAILLAARYGVAALVLCNSFVVHPRARMFRVLAVSFLFRIRPPIALLRRYLVGPRASRELLARIRAALATVAPAVLASRVRTVLSVDVASQLAVCTMPLLYLRGTHDRLVPNSSVDAVVSAASVPVSVARVDGPHLLLQTAPEAAWQAIRETILHAPAS